MRTVEVNLTTRRIFFEGVDTETYWPNGIDEDSEIFKTMVDEDDDFDYRKSLMVTVVNLLDENFNLSLDEKVHIANKLYSIE